MIAAAVERGGCPPGRGCCETRLSDITRNLGHPSIVGVGRDAGNMHRSGGEVDEEQDVIRDQPLDRVHLDAQEIGRCQAFPVGFEKR